MPKNFVFYNPEEHQKIIELLEEKQPAAIICIPKRDSVTAGGLYPYPLIEDGDFHIPSVYTSEEDGKELLLKIGETAFLQSLCERKASKAFNPIGRIGNPSGKRIVVTAHIDAKQGTPGAIDNGTGVAILLLLAELLKDYSGNYLIEIVAFNGEDYYAVPGQMNYIAQNEGKFGGILLNINIDGAGLKDSKTAVSFYEIPDELKTEFQSIIAESNELVEGTPWVQGDHSIFVQLGVPAAAISSNWFIKNMETQDITHSPKDNTSIVSCKKLGEIASALNNFIRKLG